MTTNFSTMKFPLSRSYCHSVSQEKQCFCKGIAKGGVKNRNKGGCKRLFAFVHVCLRLLAFVCVFASAFACVCQRLSAFVCVCSHLLTPPFVAPPSAWHCFWMPPAAQKKQSLCYCRLAVSEDHLAFFQWISGFFHAFSVGFSQRDLFRSAKQEFLWRNQGDKDCAK